MQLPSAFSRPSSKKFKKSPSKKFLIFQEMELSGSKIKKVLIFQKIKLIARWLNNFLYFRKWNFLVSYFSYISGRKCPSPKNKKNLPWQFFFTFSQKKISLYFRKWNFLILSLKAFVLYFQILNFLALRIKKFWK